MNDFNQVAKTPLEEWIYYLNTGNIPSDATAPGLEEARERLKLDSMTKDELSAYYRHLDNVVILRSNIQTERMEGMEEGMEKGLKKGREEGLKEGRLEANRKTVSNLKKLGATVEFISQATGLSKEEIEAL